MNEIVRYSDVKDFARIIKPLEEMYTPLTDEQRDIYYDMLKGKDRDLLHQAVNRLLTSHAFKRFPLIKEIRTEIVAANSLKLRRESEDFQRMKDTSDCLNCHGTGFELFEKSYPDTDRVYDTARHCLCPIGKHLNNTVKWRGK